MAHARHHEQDCSELSKEHIKLHNMMQDYLIKGLSRYHATLVSAANGNLP